MFTECALGERVTDLNFHRCGPFMNAWIREQLKFSNWNGANTDEMQNLPMQPGKVIVSCEFWAGGSLGAYFFEYDIGLIISVTDEHSWQMIINNFLPEFDGFDMIPTVRGFVAHNFCHFGYSARAIRGHGHLMRKWYQPATEVMIFYSVRLFLLEFA